jgi:hypothetical protein
MPADQTLFRFEAYGDASAWSSVDDAVMGGVSQSRLTVTPDRTGVFSGVVSTKRNGGFASVRSAARRVDLRGFTGVRLRVRGDGKRYKLTLRTDPPFDGVAYQQGFRPGADVWREIDLPFDRFAPTFRGRPAPEAGPLDPRFVVTIGFTIADAQTGPFRLEIASIAAYRKTGEGGSRPPEGDGSA